MKTLMILANIAFALILVVQLSYVLEGYFNPTTTRTWEEDVPLKDMDFPLVVKICITPAFNQSALVEMGYDNTASYLFGISRFNHSMVGWAGHTKDFRTKGSVEEVLAHITDNRMKKKILDSVFVWFKGEGGKKGGLLSKQLKQANRVSYPNNCQSLLLSDIGHIQIMWLEINDLGNYSLEVHFVGDTLDTGRRIKEHSFQSTGDVIRYTRYGEMAKSYMVGITQRVLVE